MLDRADDSHDLLVVTGVTKTYQGVHALQGVDFDLRRGEIHGLLGGNGAGKSTLVNVLSGVVTPDGGKVVLEGEQIELRRPSDALGRGIVTVHQELSLVPALSTLDNIFLGRELRRGLPGLRLLLDRRSMESRVRRLADDFGLTEEDLSLPIGDFGALKKRVIEIIKALAFDPKVLILDEPTSGLEEEERQNLFGHMGRLKSQGVSLIWVTHHLDELFGLADRATVFRDGAKVGTVDIAASDVDGLVRLMFGEEARQLGELGGSRPSVTSERADAEEVLRLTGVSRFHVLRDISFTVKKGEILGIAGLVGAGRTELARAIMGVDKITSGELHVGGRRVRIRNSSQAYRRGLALLPEDRKQLGILPDFSIAQNISISNLPSVAAGLFLSGRKENALAEDYTKRLTIRSSSPRQAIKNLSGGNQQKAIVARCLNTNPELVIFDEPTQGIDISAKVEVHELIRDYVAAGGAAIVVASEIEELLDLSHSVIIMQKGRIVGRVEDVPQAMSEHRFDEIKHRILSLSAGKGGE